MHTNTCLQWTCSIVSIIVEIALGAFLHECMQCNSQSLPEFVAEINVWHVSWAPVILEQQRRNKQKKPTLLFCSIDIDEIPKRSFKKCLFIILHMLLFKGFSVQWQNKANRYNELWYAWLILLKSINGQWLW